MPRFNRAVGGVRSFAKRKGRNAPTRREAAAPAQVAALKSFGFPVPHYLKAYEMPDQPTRVTDAKPVAGGIDVRFSDGHEYRFHNMWLRDACRDNSHVLTSQERRLDASPLTTRLGNANVARVSACPSGETVEVNWNEGTVGQSKFDATWLRTFADTVAKPLATPSTSAMTTDEKQDADWFDFIAGRSPVRAKPQHELRLMRNDERHAIPTVSYADLHAGCTDAHEELLVNALDPGAVIVTGVPSDDEYSGETLQDFASRFLGGLQKHPLREAPHWTISTCASTRDAGNTLDTPEKRAASNAFNTDQQLANHTDQSLYDDPGLLLAFHCASGEGSNSLTDGFAVAYAMRERHPELFDALTSTGMAAGRRLEYYAAGSLSFDTEHKVLQTDASGALVRVQYHESYRAPLNVPYDAFTRYWDALSTFYSMVHSEEFQTHVTLRAGEMLLMNNWRTLHGRAGLRGKARTIVGGTVTREACYSKARELRRAQAGIAPGADVGMPTRIFGEFADHRGVRPVY